MFNESHLEVLYLAGGIARNRLIHPFLCMASSEIGSPNMPMTQEGLLAAFGGDGSPAPLVIVCGDPYSLA
jgi:hypothetical protein